MKPLPNITDEAAMILRGKRSALGSARNDAAEHLRDYCTRLQSCDYSATAEYAAEADKALKRLLVIATAWEELK